MVSQSSKKPPVLPPGSLPPVLPLLSITGPLELMQLGQIAGGEAAFLQSLTSVSEYSDDELVLLLYSVIWCLRGRNGLLQDHEVD